MSDVNQNPEKKIIVDEDWKSRVDAERAAANEPKAEPPKPSAETEADQQMPVPSLSYLASTLYLQAAMSLGLFPHPTSGKAEVRLPLAKHAIDTLDILQQKTEGNRTADESDEIEAMLHQLRLAFVEVQKRGGSVIT